MEFILALAELGKGLLGIETAKKQAELQAMQDLFTLAGEEQRRRLIEEESRRQAEAHEMQMRLAEEELLQNAPLKRSMMKEQIAGMQLQTAAGKEELMQRQFTNLYTANTTPEVVERDPSYSDEFKRRYKDYFNSRSFLDTVAVAKSEEEVKPLLDRFPPDVQKRMATLARAIVLENQRKDYLSSLQVDTAEMQAFEAARTMAIEHITTLINSRANWDKMPFEQRKKYLEKAIGQLDLPVFVKQFMTDKMLNVYAQMDSQTALLARRALVLGGIEHRFGLEKIRAQGAEQRKAIMTEGAEERKTQQQEFFSRMALGAFTEAGGGGTAAAGGAKSIYQPTPLTSFLKESTNLLNQGTIVDATQLNKINKELSDYLGSVAVPAEQRAAMMATINEMHAALGKLGSARFYAAPTSNEATQYFNAVIRGRYIEWKLAGLDDYGALSQSLKDLEAFVNKTNSRPLRQMLAAYKQAIERQLQQQPSQPPSP